MGDTDPQANMCYFAGNWYNYDNNHLNSPTYTLYFDHGIFNPLQITNNNVNIY